MAKHLFSRDAGNSRPLVRRGLALSSAELEKAMERERMLSHYSEKNQFSACFNSSHSMRRPVCLQPKSISCQLCTLLLNHQHGVKECLRRTAAMNECPTTLSAFRTKRPLVTATISFRVDPKATTIICWFCLVFLPIGSTARGRLKPQRCCLLP